NTREDEPAKLRENSETYEQELSNKIVILTLFLNDTAFNDLFEWFIEDFATVIIANNVNKKISSTC
ncbi:5625_t:CDS:1, partial [Gigaspora margarita]